MSQIDILDKVLDGTYNGPVEVVIGQNLEVTDLSSLVEYTSAMDDKVADAAQSALEAASSSEDASQAKSAAELAAAQAKQSEENAAAVVTGGTATITSQPGKIPLADANGKIDDAWLGALSRVRSESDMAHMRAVNDEMFAASGFVHMGKMSSANGRKTVNEGLTLFNPATENYRNALFLGETGGARFGASKTNSSVVNIAGFISELVDLGKNWGNCFVKFPEAEAGTRVYDSATGVSIDYAKEIDPKYGNIAPNHNEAVARAFEGDFKNADFRLGDDGSWSGLATMKASSITGGVLYFEDYAASGDSYIHQAVNYPDGQEYDLEIDVLNIDSGARLYVELAYGGTSPHDNVLIDDAGIHKTRLTVPSDSGGFVQIRIRDYLNSGAGISINSIRIKKSTQEVVTERVDMFGFEGWLEQVTTANPFVYKYGLIQSQATTMDGIATTSSNRPDSYYAVYTGDTTSRGKGVNFWALSANEQEAIVSNPKNHLYRMKNGDLVQWRIRQRTIAGAGNGDWNNLKPINGAGNPLSYSGSSVLSPQGKLDSIVNTRNNGRYHDQQWGASIGNSLAKSNGIFLATLGNGPYNLPDTTKGYNGECYFYVIATVPRLNQGAYHPSFNPKGARKWQEYGVVTNNWNTFSPSKFIGANPFLIAASLGDFGGRYESGALGTGSSGRPDGKYYDAIYASGLGGVIDHRLKYGAWDASSSEQAAAVREEVKNGTYRGREKLVRMRQAEVYDAMASNASVGGLRWVDSGKAVKWSDIPYSLKLQQLSKQTSASQTAVSPLLRDLGFVCENEDLRGSVSSSDSIYIYIPQATIGEKVLVPFETDITVEGEFTQTDVIGDPANIFQIDALKDGWLGGWINDFTSRKVKPTRKLVDSSVTFIKNDDGVSWGSATTTVDLVNNTIDAYFDTTPNRVGIITYKAFAKQTIPCNKSTVLNGDKGIGMVEVTQSYRTDGYSALLAESLSGKIQTSPNGNSVIGRCGLLSLAMGDSGFSESGGWLGDTKHSPITLAAPANNGPAHKFLSYQKESSQQANLGYLWTELVHNGTDWGDDSLIHVADNISKRTDLNGNPVLYGTAELAKPYGFIKNKT